MKLKIVPKTKAQKEMYEKMWRKALDKQNQQESLLHAISEGHNKKVRKIERKVMQGKTIRLI